MLWAVGIAHLKAWVVIGSGVIMVATTGDSHSKQSSPLLSSSMVPGCP